MDIRCPYPVARDKELARLHAQLTEARAGRSAVGFVSGEAGVGKSRLVREVSEPARDDGFTVLAGRAVPTPGQAAYRPISEVLAQALRTRDFTQAPELSPWLPILRSMLPGLRTAAATTGAEATAHGCGEALVQLLQWLRGAGPVLVMLEDLHWADPDTVDAIEYLADNLADGSIESVVCLATLRSEPSTGALDLVRRLAQRDTATHLELSRLSDGAVAEMVRACMPDAPDELVVRVQETAEGIPLLVEELLATPGVPASMGEAVRTRVAELSDDERSVLYAAAVLGRDFDWVVLPSVVDLPVEQVTTALERAVDAMLVTVDGDGFRFRHALIREAVLAMLVPPRRVSLARVALATLDTVRPDHDHADLALQAGDRSRAGALMTASGRASLQRGALGTAVRTLRRAIEVIDDPAAQTDPEGALVQALALAGRLDEALEVGEGLLARLRSNASATADDDGSVDHTRATVHLELARAAVASTQWPTASRHLAAAKELLIADGDRTMRAQADVLEAEVALSGDDMEEARRATDVALAAAESAGVPEIRCHALELVGRSHRVRDLAAARAAFNEAYRTAEEADLAVWRMRALHELGTIDLLDSAGTETLLAARQVAEQLGALSTAVVLDLQLAAGYLLRFEIDLARACLRRAVPRSRRLRLGRTLALALFFDAEASASAGDRGDMERAAAETVRAAPGDVEIEGVVWAMKGVFELMWGDRRAATSALDRGIALLHTVAHSGPGLQRGLWALVHAVEHRPDAAECVTAVRRSGATVMRPNRGLLRYAEAVLAHSVDHVADGDTDLAHLPVWQHLGRSLVAEAALADGWGSPQQWLREAQQGFEAYGLDHLAHRCEGLLRHRPRSVPNGATPRELEVLDLVADGLANKEIAARLHVSVRTVEKHVESLLRKSGARSRTQLVAFMGETT